METDSKVSVPPFLLLREIPNSEQVEPMMAKCLSLIILLGYSVTIIWSTFQTVATHRTQVASASNKIHHHIFVSRGFEITEIEPTSWPSRQPSLQPTPQPNLYPSSQPVSQPKSQPTGQLTEQPTGQPTSQPTGHPTRQPMTQPTRQPTNQPFSHPTVQPSRQPSGQPSNQPVTRPSSQPSNQPSSQPSHHPNRRPTSGPSSQPSSNPSQPTGQPSSNPSGPSGQPSSNPTQPTSQPSNAPTSQPLSCPSVQPSNRPSSVPSNQPSVLPTLHPSTHPSNIPSSRPSKHPSVQPTCHPSAQPTGVPSCQPFARPTHQPSSHPSLQPTSRPSWQPNGHPSKQPLSIPSSYPSRQPTSQPSAQPSAQPYSRPSEQPSVQPSHVPTIQPFAHPTSQPSTKPISTPSCLPTNQPSTQPSIQPTSAPSGTPSSYPSRLPTAAPSRQPSSSPSSLPSRRPLSRPTSLPLSEPSSLPTLIKTSPPTAQPTTSPLFDRPSSRPSVQPSHRPSVQPSEAPSNQPSSKPSHQPSSQPSFCLGGGVLPLNVSLSLRGTSKAVIISLPFFYLSPTISGDGFEDVVVNHDASSAQGVVLFGNTSYHGINEITADEIVNQQRGYFVVPAIGCDFSGRSVSNAGDVNGDGYDDLIIGVPRVSACYLMFGTSNGFMNMTQGVTIFGVQSSDLTGWSVSGAGDVNSDGFADIVIGAPYGGDNQEGVSYVLYGHPQHVRNVQLKELQSSQGFLVVGENVNDHSGLSVSSAGDVNDDGFDDIIIGALVLSAFQRGAAYVVFGGATMTNKTHLSNMSETDGFALHGEFWSWFGYSVSGAGDVNGDGFDDMIIGSVPSGSVSSSSAEQISYLIFGSKINFITSVANMTASQGVVITGGGVVVSGVSDINGDGIDDVLLVSDAEKSFAGRVVYAPDLYAPPVVFDDEITQDDAATANPSSHPSVTPTILYIPGVGRPSKAPHTASPSPARTTKPSKRPRSSAVPTSSVPSVWPSSTRYPTLMSSAPSVKPTPKPSVVPRSIRPSVVTPSLQPSSTVYLNASNNCTIITVGGVYYIIANVSGSQITVNTSDDVVIYGSNGGRPQRHVYVVMPFPGALLTIHSFINTTDVLDLHHFFSINSFNQLNLTEGSVVVNLPAGQRVRLTDMTIPDVGESNFLFSILLAETVDNADDDSPFVEARTTTIISITICAAIILAVLQKVYKWWFQDLTVKDLWKQRDLESPRVWLPEEEFFSTDSINAATRKKRVVLRDDWASVSSDNSSSSQNNGSSSGGMESDSKSIQYSSHVSSEQRCQINTGRSSRVVSSAVSNWSAASSSDMRSVSGGSSTNTPHGLFFEESKIADDDQQHDDNIDAQESGEVFVQTERLNDEEEEDDGDIGSSESSSVVSSDNGSSISTQGGEVSSSDSDSESENENES